MQGDYGDCVCWMNARYLQRHDLLSLSMSMSMSMPMPLLSWLGTETAYILWKGRPCVLC